MPLSLLQHLQALRVGDRYEQNFSAGTSFNTPQSFCNGPANARSVSGFGAAATPALTSQFGLRFSF
jgi:hypothetical protein